MTDQNEPNITNQRSSKENEIDYIQLTKTIWSSRKKVIKIMLIFIGVGVIIALLTPKVYTASTTFVPQTKDSKVGGSLGGLAAIAGINLGGMGGNSGISPELYPQIINSIPFQLELLQTYLTIEGQAEKVTYADYYANIRKPGVLAYIKKYTIGLPGIIISAIRGKPKSVTLSGPAQEHQVLVITLEEDRLIQQLIDQITLQVLDEDGYLTISANMPEAIASAELAYRVEELLQQYVIDFKIQKSKEQLTYIKARYFEAEEKFKTVQRKLANKRDHNQNISKAIAKTSTEILEDEYNLIYGVYSELAKQLEAQHLQVTEDTPVFTVLRPVTVPLVRSKPKRAMIVVIWALLGVVVGVGMVFRRTFVLEMKEKWNK
ncbi:MAG: capsular polysaccharide biosynthesis protein [Ulvibacter sp.]|jgi:capsular polysaccharide biosynthesis protein